MNANLHDNLEKNNHSTEIMVVDDEPDIRELVKINLEKEKKKVITAKNGEKALKILEDKNPDIILLDINMPKLNGWETIEEIDKRGKLEDTAVIMLTVERLSIEKIVKNDVEGIVDYIEKPFDREEIIKTTKDVFSRINKMLKHEEMIRESKEGDRSLAEAYKTWTKTSMIHKRFLKKLRKIKEETVESDRKKTIDNLIEGEKNMIDHLHRKRYELLRIVGLNSAEPV